MGGDPTIGVAWLDRMSGEHIGNIQKLIDLNFANIENASGIAYNSTIEHSRVTQAMQSQEQRSMSLDEANSIVTRVQEELRLHELQSSGPYPLTRTVKVTTEVVQAVRMVIAHRVAALYPDGEASRLTFQMTPEQEARVESLMKVPMHLLEMDDKLHRETLAVQRERAAYGQMPFHKNKIDKLIAQGHGEWGYWSCLFSSKVNGLLPRKASSTPN